MGKGRFHGATEKRGGKIEAADGGTLFLMRYQSLTLTSGKLLRFLQEKSTARLEAARWLRQMWESSARRTRILAYASRTALSGKTSITGSCHWNKGAAAQDAQGGYPVLARHFLKESVKAFELRRKISQKMLKSIGSLRLPAMSGNSKTWWKRPPFFHARVSSRDATFSAMSIIRSRSRSFLRTSWTVLSGRWRNSRSPTFTGRSYPRSKRLSSA